jgi:hypothetical protein
LSFAPIIAAAPAAASAAYASQGGLLRQRLKPDFFLLVTFPDLLQKPLGLFDITAGK